MRISLVSRGQGTRRSPYGMVRLVGVCLTALLLGSCAAFNGEESSSQLSQRSRSSNELPQIHSIGTGSILAFDTEKTLTIPVTGIYFADETLIWTISLTGVTPLEEGEDFTIRQHDGFTQNRMEGSQRANLIEITLTKRYTKLLQTGDNLKVQVSISDGTEHLARARIQENLELAAKQAELLTVFLNEERSPEDRINQVMHDLLGFFDRSNKSIQMLVGDDQSALDLEEIQQDLVRISQFLTRRVEIPVNLRTEAESDERRDLDIEDQQEKGEIRHWYVLENVVQEVLRKQRSILTRRAARSIRAPLLSSASRQFVFYSSKDYREQILAGRIPLHDISAYPLPYDETEFLFGSDVADLYFVVRLSIRNTGAADKLISTGLIKAFGRALVNHEPPDGSDEVQPSFTVPVEIVPQSRQHVYTIIADNKPDRPREVIFRALEFTGSLATAIFTAFGGTTDAIKATAIATGVGLPQGQKLFPDPVPAYLANIVNYSMPDLVKVPRNSVVGHRYLFFSKGDLQAVVSDVRYARQVANSSRGQGPKVVYLAFDTLDIPYENVDMPEDPQLLATKQLIESIEDATEQLEEQRNSTAEAADRAVERVEEARARAEQQAQDAAQLSESVKDAVEQIAQAQTDSIQQNIEAQRAEAARIAAEQQAEAERQRVAAEEAAQAKQKALDRVEALQQELDSIDTDLNQILTAWNASADVDDFHVWDLSYARYRGLADNVDRLLARDQQIGEGLPQYDAYHELIQETLAAWDYVLTQFNTERLRARFGGSSVFGSRAMTENERNLGLVRTAVEGGDTLEQHSSDLDEIQSDLDTARLVLDFYRTVANDLNRLNLTRLLNELTDANVGQLESELQSTRIPLERYANLASGLPVFTGLRVPAPAED